jgi:hypothetical protein
MAMAGTRYELRVGTRVSEAMLAAFRIPVRPTVVPGNTVYRLRVPADRDLAEVLQLLTESDVQVLEIRRCTERRRPDRGSPRAETVQPADVGAASGGVVLPFARRSTESTG